MIDRDIPRCYPDHSQFSDATGQGQRDLGDILKAYSHYNTQLEYCQGMGRLAGCMLMHMPAEVKFPLKRIIVLLCIKMIINFFLYVGLFLVISCNY